MKTYFDTSYLVALYVPNDHTAAALRYRSRNREPIFFTPPHRLELRTTVRQCAYGGVITQAAGHEALRNIEDDLDDGTLIHQPLDWTVSLRQAESVAERFGWTNPCRSLDLWHIAETLDLPAGAFVTFDKLQCALAKDAGLAATTPV